MLYKDQSGRTMLEMLGVLAIMGIIVYGAISSINYGMASYRVNRLYVEIPNIIKGIQDMYLSVFGRNSFPNITCNTSEHAEFEKCSGKTGTALTDCKYCQTLLQNGILTADIHNIAIELKTASGLKIKLDAGNKSICERLAKMDWLGESIECTSNENKCHECSETDDCCSVSNELVFSPK